MGELQVFTNVEKTKKLSEKPFLYLDNGEYKIFVPDLQKIHLVQAGLKMVIWVREKFIFK